MSSLSTQLCEDMTLPGEQFLQGFYPVFQFPAQQVFRITKLRIQVRDYQVIPSLYKRMGRDKDQIAIGNHNFPINGQLFKHGIPF